MNDTHPMALNPNTVLIAPLFRVRGGRETHRRVLSEQQNALGKHVSVDEVTVIVHDQQEYDDAQAIVSMARYALKKFSTFTIVGHLLDKAILGDLATEIDHVRGIAHDFNGRARTCQVAISYLPIEISVALGPESARALADHVRDELCALRDALRAGQVDGKNGARSVLLRAKNLHALAVGVQSDAIRFGIEEGRDSVARLKEAIKNSEAPESAGRHLDLGMIDSAIVTFTYDPDAAPTAVDLSSVGI